MDRNRVVRKVIVLDEVDRIELERLGLERDLLLRCVRRARCTQEALGARDLVDPLESVSNAELGCDGEDDARGFDPGLVGEDRDRLRIERRDGGDDHGMLADAGERYALEPLGEARGQQQLQRAVRAIEVVRERCRDVMLSGKRVREAVEVDRPELDECGA